MAEKITELDATLYEHLIQENSKYIEKVHETWNQKLAIVGAMAAFVVAYHAELAKNAPLPLQAVIWSIPAMCILLDLHTFEKVLQARLLSHFLMSEFEDRGAARPWFRTFWAIESRTGQESHGLIYYLVGYWFQKSDRSQVEGLVGLRSAVTGVVFMFPTIIVFFLAAYAVGLPLDGRATYAVAACSILYVVGGNIFFRKVRREIDSGSTTTVPAENSGNEE